MNIYILRHGEASFMANSDALRPLTEFGITQAERIGAFLQENQIQFDFAFVSPYLRAQQTFQALLPFVEVKQSFTESDLTPNGDEDNALASIFAIAPKKASILLVSHLPIVCDLVSALTINHERPMFATATLACIELTEFKPQPKGSLLWMQQP